jgi:transaldolase/glucose-6-phosphate isomerase
VNKEKRQRSKKEAWPAQEARLGRFQSLVEERGKVWESERFAERLWAKDPTLWSAEPMPELSDRLGWLDLPERMQAEAPALAAFATEVKERTRYVVLLGMGGSSLAPEVFQRIAGRRRGYPELVVLDTTHPAAVRAVEARVDLGRTLFLVSSKSGTTTETLSLFRYFWRKGEETGKNPGERFAAVTDPGTPLERLARERGFAACFQAPPDVGGRYSALTVFGLLPAALIGLDIESILAGAREMADRCKNSFSGNPGLYLGAVLGELARMGRDKATFLAAPSVAAFPAWAEQLIAESTGKDGKGIVPVVDEPAGAPDVYGEDRVFVYLTTRRKRDARLEARLLDLENAGHPLVRIELRDAMDIGGEFFRWEVAVAAAGAVLGIHPFNQPDVELAKELARRAMEKGGSEASPEADAVSAADPEQLSSAARKWLTAVRAGDYIALQAFLAPDPETTSVLQTIRARLRDRLRLATTFGYGPRFLHSTGQLHKGGPDSGLFLQLVDDPVEDLQVPETEYTFRALIRAQALGDWQALRQKGRRALRVDLGRDPAGGLERLAATLENL